MNALALDLGSTTGWAMRLERPSGGAFEASGTWQLATPRELKIQKALQLDRRGDVRVRKLMQHLRQIFAPDWGFRFDFVAFEDVQFSTSTAQTQLWSSFRTCVWVAAADANLKVMTLPTGKLKKFATGSGNADKPMIEGHFRRKFPGRPSADDNERDAVFLLRWIYSQEEV